MADPVAGKAGEAYFVAEFDVAELAVVLMSAAYEVARPADVDPADILNGMHPKLAEYWARAARAAIEYTQRKLTEGVQAGAFSVDSSRVN